MRILCLIVALVVCGCSPGEDTNVKVGGSDTGPTADAAVNNASDTGDRPDGDRLPDAAPGSDATTPTDVGRTDVGPADVGGSTDVGPDMAPLVSPCPAAQPVANSACTQDRLVCEYGDDPRDNCRSRAECTGGSWLLTVPRCVGLPDEPCPATRDAASGELCGEMDAYCDYDGLVCHCTNCIDGPVIQCEGDPTWMCDVPHADPACPAAKPRLGAACGTAAQSCVYSCGFEGARVCRDGAWQPADGGACPISTAQVKRDIRYLSADELTEISNALQAIPLARYHYTDPSIGRGEKLGFIIEDLPTATPAVDQQRLMVDLYGYTSMLVADAQAREAKMRKLEARLEQLEAKGLSCGE